MCVMRVICVDDDRLQLDKTIDFLRDLPQIEKAMGFTDAKEALDWLGENIADLALLDIHMPNMSGLELASIIRTHWPDTAFVFLTEHPEYALEAFRLRASGYLLKPCSRERLQEEIEFFLAYKEHSGQKAVHVRTFGGFDCFVGGKAIAFRQAKCKELLAYLVDRRGRSVTRAEAFAILWEDRLYDRPMQKQLDVIIRSLRATLKEQGIDSILEMKSGTLRVNPEQLDCDLYRLLSGDNDVLKEYRGEYMNGYAWAELTEGYLSEKAGATVR